MTEIAISLAGQQSLVAEFHRAGVVELADVHTALALGPMVGEERPEVLLAVALAVRALRGGSVCFDLLTIADAVFDTREEETVATGELQWPDPHTWLRAVHDSPLVKVGTAPPGDRPLRLVGSTLYLERYWADEEVIRERLQQLRATSDSLTIDSVRLRAGLDRIFQPDQLAPDEADRQRIAGAAAVLGRVTVVAGGPGTGKTTTVAKILALLADQPAPAGSLSARSHQPRIALAANTGKAAARLTEAVSAALQKLPATDADRVTIDEPYTLHRLLGFHPARGKFFHHAENQLPFDIIVVDEMSMVSLPLMARLLEAVRPTSRLILVGDPDQLASVEAGAVMADITAAAASDSTDSRLAEFGPDDRGLPLPPDITNGVVRLTHTWRFGGGIGLLAAAIRAGDAAEVLNIVTAGHDDVEFIELGPTELSPDKVVPVRTRVVAAASALTSAARAGEPEKSLAGLEKHRVLCAHRTGPCGVSRWNREIERWLADEGLPVEGPIDPWYVGRPLQATKNDYELKLFNGDTGVVIETENGMRAVFGRGSQWLSYPPARLDQITTVHAMTVHRGQGSQYNEVTFVVPPPESPLLTRELLYTAVTRAMTKVSIVGTREALARAVERPANRASGLRHRL